MDEDKVRITGYAHGQGKQHATYDELPPSAKAYIATTLSFLDLESTPQRRENLTRLMNRGNWSRHIDGLKELIDADGTQLKG